MKKIVGIASFFLALAGAVLLVLTSTVIHHDILFFVGLGMFVLGFIGSLFSGKEIKEAVIRMLDFV